MPWFRGAYYRSRRVGGRVINTYVGSGPLAEIVAQLDEAEREQRRQKREAEDGRMARLDELDERVRRADEEADLLFEAAMMAAGFHRPNRGPWRKQREQ